MLEPERVRHLRGLAAGGGGASQCLSVPFPPLLTHRGNKGLLSSAVGGSSHTTALWESETASRTCHFLKSLHLKIFSVPRRQILGQRVLIPLISSVQKSPFWCTLVLQTIFTVAHTFTRSTIWVSFCCSTVTIFLCSEHGTVETSRTGVELQVPYSGRAES